MFEVGGDFLNGHIQLPHGKDIFQLRTLLIGVVAVAIFPFVSRREQTDVVIVMKGALVQLMQTGKLTGGKIK